MMVLLKNYLTWGHCFLVSMFMNTVEMPVCGLQDNCLMGRVIILRKKCFLRPKKLLWLSLFLVFQFRVRNHLFFCSRSHYCSDICLFCTRVNISRHGVSGYINKKLFVPITYFPQSIREGIVLMEKVYFFVHYHGAFAKVNIHASYVSNFGVLHYECINSPFILY